MSSIKTIIVKGKIPVDEYCSVKDTTHVYDNGIVWDACLNQTNIAKNNNKFYNIQLLETDSGKKYYTWNRWGRLGEKGKGVLTPHIDFYSAKLDFEDKFYTKTKNVWPVINFKTYSGKYTLIQRDFGISEIKQPVLEVTETKLDSKVADLIKLICDVGMMKSAMIQIGYDADKMPLGKLSKEHLTKGYEVLKNLETAILSGATDDMLADLSSRFYTLIPHSFGRNKPPTINNIEMLKVKLEMIQSLTDVSLATQLLENNTSVDEHYSKLSCDIKPLNLESKEYTIIQKYLTQTHAKTHSSYKLSILDIFEIDKNNETEKFIKSDNIQLLWHGSRLTNFTGILSQGLRIAPPEAPSTGYMFSKGVYFADSVSKSANYCFTNSTNNIGCMLLSEVSLGEMNELKDADYNADKHLNGKLSTKGLGKITPNPEETEELNGVKVPLGNMSSSGIYDTSLLYNEYIVYNVNQIKMKYLLKVRFDYI